MLAIVIPAHNEAAHIGACVAAARRAADHHQLLGEAACVIVVADSCADETAGIARAMGAEVSCIDARNVGMARAHGAERALALGARWLAFTDADTTVAEDWLVRQLDCCADAVCGVIGVHDWSPHLGAVREHFGRTYTDADGHRHIHGANLGVSARAYVQAGEHRQGDQRHAAGSELHGDFVSLGFSCEGKNVRKRSWTKQNVRSII